MLFNELERWSEEVARRRPAPSAVKLPPLVAGLDLSPSATGLVVLVGDDVRVAEEITPPLGKRGLGRAVWVAAELQQRLVSLKVSLVAVEDMAFSQPQRAHEIGGLQYLVRAMLIEEWIPSVNVPIAANKMIATGKGNSGKPQMAVGVFKRWGYEHKSDNVMDAYALSRCAQLWLRAGTPGLTALESKVLNKMTEITL